ncbi:oligosaccharide flippase family protein [Flammeovirga aprica]|uniref:Oligosaccharide flippase family protein n=1 Tax=Flammeovirga aprica JL-4 TaxID=694437 RepID=A0A7X9P292_9BACT|nr:oligosaccharide flippase family protein [Flammeovirga aprica]NME67672.1 oligosaccharide flippase family protein [Flammeovirga aprica JL-4]
MINLNKYLKSDFNQNVLKIFSGSTISSLIPLLFMPILSRMYLPSEFGKYAIYNAIIAIMINFLSGKYERAITVEADLNKSRLLSVICFILSVCLSILLVPVYLLISHFLEINILIIVLGCFFNSIYQTSNFIFIKEGLYSDLAKRDIYKSTFLILLQIVFFYTFKSINGLIIGQLLSTFLIILVSFFRMYQKDILIKNLNIKEIIELLVLYSNFPKFTIFSNALNSLTNQLPVFFLKKYFSDNSIIGNYSMSSKVVSIPNRLISNSISQVFRNEAAIEYNTIGNCRDIFVKTLIKLLLLSIFPSLALLFFGKDLFIFFFGDNWSLAGEYAQILSPFLFFRFISSPMTDVYHIVGKQSLDLLWQMLLFTLIVLSAIISINLESSKSFIVLFSLSYSLAYIINLILTFRLSKQK